MNEQKIARLERELAAAIEQRDEMKLALRDLTDAAKGLMDCKGYDLYPDGTMRPAHGLGEWVKAEDYDRLHAAAEAAQAEITALRDAEPVAWEYWREVGISEEERIVTKQPPELMQQVELYQYRPLYALPAAAIEQRDKAREWVRGELGTADLKEMDEYIKKECGNG